MMPKKTNRTRTPDQLLREALISPDEHPYPLPEKWEWLKTNVLHILVTGTTPPKKKLEYYGSYIPFVKPNDLEQGKDLCCSVEKLSEEGAKVSRIVPKNSTLVCCIGSIGKAAYTHIDCATNQQINSLIPKINLIEPLFTYYSVLAPYYQQQLKEKSSATTVSIINKSKTGRLAFPLPPLAEQRRIVARLESLLGKIRAARDLIQEARDSFATRRAAILHKAFTGELTQKWRAEHPEVENSFSTKCCSISPFALPGKWEWAFFKDVARIESNLVDPLEFLSLPHIAPNYIEKYTGRLLDYKTIEEDGVKSPKHRFCKGQIVYSKIRPYLSKLILADFDGLCSADMYPIATVLSYKFLFRYMLSKIFLDYASNAGSRTVLPKINQKELGKVPVPVPPFEEQQEIVRILESLLDCEAEANALTGMEEELELLEKSILSKAFRGELGTGDPQDEPALELLTRSLEEKHV